MYTELLKLCGFETEEIERERSRIDKAFEKAEIGREDIQRAESRVREYFDIELLGMRKCLGIWIKQLVDLVLAREEGKKIVYLSFPSHPMIGLAINFASGDVYCQAPEIVLDMTMGQIFGKMDPILEAGEAHGLPPGLGHCSLNQARVGGIVKGIVPMPDLTLTSGFFCDQTPKTDELLREVYGVANVFVDNMLDADWKEYPEISPRQVQYFGAEIERGMEQTQKALGINITEEMREKSIVDNARLWFAMLGVWEYMKSDPVPISQASLAIPFYMLATPERITMTHGFEAVATLTKEVKQRADEGKGVTEKGAPRVLILLHQTTDPSVVRMIEDLGLAIPVTCLGSLTAPMVRSITPGQYTTFGERAAYFMLCHGLYHSSPGFLERYRETCKTWQLDGVVNLYPFSCRPFSLPCLIIKKALEEDPGFPVLALEGDLWDTRNYSAQALRTRVETFAEMLRMKKSTIAA